MTEHISVIGAGLAGVEAANILTEYGFHVTLIEQKPARFSPAHTYPGFAELVCSNSLKASRLGSASGMLKEEMRLLGSVVIPAAEKNAVPAGGALAVNRERFSDYITDMINKNSKIKVLNKTQTALPEKNAVICTGPLTDGALAQSISRVCGDALSFFDAAAPIVTAESIDMSRAFLQSRYDRGDADYINCPFSKDEYEAFHRALVDAECVILRDFERHVFEGCMPVEILAKRGIDSVRYGCMKPVGLTDPRTGKRPYAAVQLRAENTERTLYNIVGFQTNLKFPEQKRVFRMIPGLQNAEFARFGVMHRNTFIDSPRLLTNEFMLKGSDNIFFGGQITGVEGYVESAASGLFAGISLARRLLGLPPIKLPETTILGALCAYISDPGIKNFQPMSANMGILPPLGYHMRDKQQRYAEIAKRGIDKLKAELKEKL